MDLHVDSFLKSSVRKHSCLNLNTTMNIEYKIILFLKKLKRVFHFLFGILGNFGKTRLRKINWNGPVGFGPTKLTPFATAACQPFFSLLSHYKHIYQIALMFLLIDSWPCLLHLNVLWCFYWPLSVKHSSMNHFFSLL